MSNRNDILWNLLGQSFKTRREIKKVGNSRDRKGESDDLKDMLNLLALAIIAIVGNEPIKIVFRRNFGKEAINKLAIFICWLAFLGVAGLAFLLGSDKKEVEKMSFGLDSQTSFYVTGIFYIILAFYTLIKGLRAANNSENNHVPYKYQGDSHLLRFMLKDGYKMKEIQFYAEPLYAIGAGICFSLFINIWGGIPIIVCGLSIWGKLAVDYIFGNHMPQQVASQNQTLNNPDEFYTVQ